MAEATRLIRANLLPAAAFCVAAIYVPLDVMFSGAYMPRWWAMALLLPLASPLDPRSLEPRVGACLLAGLAWAALSLAWTPIPAEGAMDLIFMVLLSLALLAGASSESAEIDRALAWLGWGVAISAPAAAWQAIGPLGHTIGPPSFHPGGLFFSSEILGVTAAPTFVWALCRGRHALAAALVIALALSASRAGLAAAVVGVLYAWAPARRRGLAVAAVALGGAAVAAVFWLAAAGDELARASSALTRVVLWLAGLQSVTPLGQGLGWWAVGFPGPLEEYAHSDAIQLAAELGAGALPLLAVPAMVLWRGAGNVAERSAFVCLCVEGLVGFPLHLPVPALMAALLAGGMARRRVRVRRDEPVGRTSDAGDLQWAAAHGARVVPDLSDSSAGLPLRAAPPADGDHCAPGVWPSDTDRPGRGKVTWTST